MSSSPAALLQEAVRFHERGALDEAAALYTQVLAADPNSVEALYRLGRASCQQGRLPRGIELFRKVIELDPDHAQAHNLLGMALNRLGHSMEALRSFDRALAGDPNLADAWANKADILGDLGRFDEALNHYDRALALNADLTDAWCNRGAALHQTGRYAEALESIDRALATDPDLAMAHLNRGKTLSKLERHGEAIESFDKAIAIRGDIAHFHADRGAALRNMQRGEEALASLDRALALDPSLAEAHYNRGILLRDLRRLDEARASLDRALALKPDFVEAHFELGNVMKDLDVLDEAVKSYDRAIMGKPDYAEAFLARGTTLIEAHIYEQGTASLLRTLQIDPEHKQARGLLANALRSICDWKENSRMAAEINSRVMKNTLIISPFAYLFYTDDPARQLQCARNYLHWLSAELPRPLSSSAIYRHDKMRIAYLSGDFHDHSSAYLIAQLFELHDRARFEITGISSGPDDNSDTRRRLINSFDHFFDVRYRSDGEVARMLRDLEIDIAVDLKGHTKDARMKILAHRPAPIQATYLGYQGTTGAEYIDYVIGDEIALPFDLQPFFTENIVHLPVSHQVSDSTRQIPSLALTRRDAGLPEDGFVFCSFNDNDKIKPAIFDIWTRLLTAVEGSVLWLIADSDLSRQNLRQEAAARGIDPARIVFTEKTHIGEHLFRHRLADLYLDTLPVCAHTSASRTLWAGLPILTCAGRAFAGRITASMLHAVGLPELVTHSLEEYEALALKLATDRPLLAGIRRRLEENRRTSSLFDTDRFRRHLEKAYTIMWERHRRGEPAKSFAVAPD